MLSLYILTFQRLLGELDEKDEEVHSFRQFSGQVVEEELIAMEEVDEVHAEAPILDRELEELRENAKAEHAR